IAEEHMQHLFEPFYTSKEQGKGTGLGLAMLFGAIKTHHGSVGVKSTEGEGSTFSIYLPTLEAGDRIELATDSMDVHHGDGQTILLVDDDVSIIETGKEVLAALGYQVQIAGNGQQAIDLYVKHADAIDLIIMDIVMPVMGGDRAAEAIRQLDPAVKIVFSTGYDRDVQCSMEDEIVLNKPFSIIEMSHVIERQLRR
ncbi:MAG: response regulator, partial [Mariprofundus sp.]|nr:response regulator [Mariprofundus sp.]